MPGLYQSLTYRLHDSLPQSAFREIHSSVKKGSEHYHSTLDAWLDKGIGSCWLRNPEIAWHVEDTFMRFDGERYRLLHWAVMSNHVHVMIAQEPGHSLSQIVRSWKAYTAAMANRILGRKGQFWMPDYFDRMIRDAEHYFYCADYIENNPVRAGLVTRPEEWPFSSAFARTRSAAEAARSEGVVNE
jgi:REP element-mobilizing transposase RayT